MAIERFYIIKDGKRDGPFDEPYVRFLLENDELTLKDYCESEDGERMRLSQLYEAMDDDEEDVDSEEEEEDDGEEYEYEADDDEAEEYDEEDEEPRRKIVRVLYTGHPSFLKYRVSWLLVIIGAVGGILLGPHTLAGMLAGFALGLISLCFIVVHRSSHLYVITSRRIESIIGLVAKDSTEIRVEDIRTINIKRSGLIGIIGVGTVEFSSAGDAIDVAFVDIWRARRIKKIVRRLQDET